MRPGRLRTLGGVGAVLTCPCYMVPLVLLAGGTAGAAWLGHYLPLFTIGLGIVFLLSLWLLFRSSSVSGCGPAGCATPGPDENVTYLGVSEPIVTRVD